MNKKMPIHFEKAAGSHIDTIFSWLAEPYVMEFWDNTQEHKDDILNFVNGRKEPSNYADGKYAYWIASFNDEPFAMLMTIQETHASPINQEKLAHLSKTGHTYCLDYMIGNSSFFGKGYGAITLSEFIDYFRENIDIKADTFLIDPERDNARANHVYMKAGFKHVCDFMMEGDVSGAGKVHHLLARKFDPKISVMQATLDYYPVIQNMARFYVYDISRECGHISADWALPQDGLYECFDFKSYFLDESKKAYLVKVYDEIAGFVLLDRDTKDVANSWNMGEFFIIAKFQGAGIASHVAHQIWEMNPGTWEVSVIPENKRTLIFWGKAIGEFTCGAFNKSLKAVAYDEHQPKRVIFEFDTSKNKLQPADVKINIRPSTLADIDEMVSLSLAKRLNYEKAQPRFWRYAGPEGDEAQRRWFKELLEAKDYLMLTAYSFAKASADKEAIQENSGSPRFARDDGVIVGFVIGRLVPAPEVYNPGGLTLMIDDFCVKSEDFWQSVGSQLIRAIKTLAKEKGASQILVVCGAHDEPKRKFLKEQNLSIASEWFIGDIS